MRFISWNVNGLRACMQKGFAEYFAALHADFFCLQETKLQPEQISIDSRGIFSSGTRPRKRAIPAWPVFTKHAPLSVTYGVGVDDLDHEGRMITLEYEKFYLVTCYTPNAQDALKRIDHRLSWDDAFRERLRELDARKPVIACGDLNVAHQEIDLKNPGSNRRNPGFSDEERELYKTACRRIYGHLPFPEPRACGCVFLVELPLPCEEKRTQAGASIIFSSPTGCKNAIEAAPIYSEIYGSTTARSGWN